MNRSDLNIGDRVSFGRANGEKTLGEIVKLNPTKAKVRILESRGNGRGGSVGAVWGVPYSMMTLADATATPAASRPSLRPLIPTPRYGLTQHEQCSEKGIRVGSKVTLTGKGGETLTGWVDRINRKTITIKNPPLWGTRYWRATASLLTLAEASMTA